MGVRRQSSEGKEEFDIFCSAMLPQVVAFATRITGDFHESEDIAIEALARTYLRWNRLSSVSWREAWVFRVAANLSIDVLRRSQRTVRGHIEPYAGVDIGPMLNRSELIDLIRRLPQRQRDVIFLRYYHDLSYAEIAHALQLSQGSVKTHIHRAIDSLGSVLLPRPK